MAAIASLVLADGAATPVNHTFTPVNVVNGVASWKDKSGGVPAGYPQVTLSVREPSKASSTFKVQAKITVPKLETSPNFLVPTEAYRNLMNIDVVMHERCTDQDRKDLYAYGKNLLAHAILGSAIKDVEPVWG